MFILRRHLVVISVVLAAATTTLYGFYHLSKSRTYQIFGDILSRVETDDRVVALTFDDGPTKEATPEILRILKENGIRGTFFLCGKEIEANPAEALTIAADGHEIGNHTFSHQRMVFRSWSFIAGEIEKTDNLIRNAGYSGNIYFRAPYGKHLFLLPYYLQKTGRLHVTYDVEPETIGDVAGNPQKIVEHVFANTRPGSIILLHVMYPKATRDALPEIIRGLKAKGFSFATISELRNHASRSLQ